MGGPKADRKKELMRSSRRIKKAPPKRGIFHSWRIYSHYFEFSGGFFAAIGDDFVLDLRALIHRAQTRLLNGGDVQEHVLAAAVRLDEAITLGRVEPLNSTSSHDILSNADTMKLHPRTHSAAGIRPRHEGKGPLEERLCRIVGTLVLLH
jgi:hypothetical protein